MTIKIGEAIMALGAVVGMNREKMDFDNAMKLYRLRKELQGVAEVALEYERDIVERNGGRMTEEGYAEFETVEARKEFDADKKEMMIRETEIFLPEGIKIKAPERISMGEIEALEGLVEFE